MNKKYAIPVTINDWVACSNKKLKVSSTEYRYVSSLEFLRTKHGYYFYKIYVKKLYHEDKEEDAFITQIALELSVKNFEVSIDWISETTEQCGYTNTIGPEYARIKTCFDMAKRFYSPSEIKTIIEFVVRQVVTSNSMEWIDSIIVTEGFSGLIKYKSDTDIIRLRSCQMAAKGLKKLLQSRGLQLKKTSGALNFYEFEKVNFRYKPQKPEHSYINPFFIKTSGFNQCFQDENGDYYSLVEVLDSNEPDSSYRVYIVGCDDSSYSAYFDKLDDAIQTAENLSVVSAVINNLHIKAMGFKFTN